MSDKTGTTTAATSHCGVTVTLFSTHTGHRSSWRRTTSGVPGTVTANVV